MTTQSATAEPPRAIRDNNPGDVDFIPSVKWQGQIGNDGRFSRFDTMTNGVRACGIDLLSYVYRDGIRPTVQAIITHFAPGNENPTGAYIANVCTRMGVEPDALLNLRDPDTLGALLRAIFIQEEGEAGFALILPGDFSAGVMAALVHG